MLIVGGLIGWAAGAILGKDIPGGILGNIIAGIVGSAVGSWLLGHWGPSIAGIYIFPSIIRFNHFNFLNFFSFKSIKKIDIVSFERLYQVS